MGEPTTPQQVKIWDAPTRLFHWALVILVLISFISGEFGGMSFTPPAWLPGGGNMVANMTVHMWSGIAILALVLFRILWGLIGSSTARFINFIRGPRAIFGYLRGLFGNGAVGFMAGHNPAGAVMVVAVLLLLLAQASVGLFLKEDDFFGIAGPLNPMVSEATATRLAGLHETNWTIIEVLIILHILANLYYWLVRRENLIGAMFTGKRDLPAGVAAPRITFAPAVLGLITFAVAVGIVYAVINLGP